MDEATRAQERLTEERTELLARLDRWLEAPMLALAIVWLALLGAELVIGERPALARAGYVVWGIFVLEFAVDLAVAPRKRAYLRSNWLKGVALLLPALRVLRVVRLARAARLVRFARGTRGVRLLRIVSGLNRGMRALGAAMRRQGFGYVLASTLLVTLVGAAGMVAFEGAAAGGPLDRYGAALWWTAMVMTTMGSDYWPQTAEGRVLCFLLSLYAFAMFGYVTATLATWFVGRDAEAATSRRAEAGALERLERELAALRAELRTLLARAGEG